MAITMPLLKTVNKKKNEIGSYVTAEFSFEFNNHCYHCGLVMFIQSERMSTDSVIQLHPTLNLSFN